MALVQVSEALLYKVGFREKHLRLFYNSVVVFTLILVVRYFRVKP